MKPNKLTLIQGVWGSAYAVTLSRQLSTYSWSAESDILITDQDEPRSSKEVSSEQLGNDEDESVETEIKNEDVDDPNKSDALLNFLMKIDFFKVFYFNFYH